MEMIVCSTAKKKHKIPELVLEEIERIATIGRTAEIRKLYGKWYVTEVKRKDIEPSWRGE